MNEFEQKIESMFEKQKASIEHFGIDFAKSRYNAASDEVWQLMGSAGALRELLTAIEFAGHGKVTIEEIIQAIESRIESYYARRLATEKECNYISEKIAAYEKATRALKQKPEDK